MNILIIYDQSGESEEGSSSRLAEQKAESLSRAGCHVFVSPSSGCKLVAGAALRHAQCCLLLGEGSSRDLAHAVLATCLPVVWITSAEEPTGLCWRNSYPVGATFRVVPPGLSDGELLDQLRSATGNAIALCMFRGYRGSPALMEELGPWIPTPSPDGKKSLFA